MILFMWSLFYVTSIQNYGTSATYSPETIQDLPWQEDASLRVVGFSP